jgi:hypothetical protein
MILSLTSSVDNGMTTLLLVLCAIVIMIVLLRRHQFRGTTRRDMGRDHIARLRDQHQLRQSMDELLVQLEEVSRSVGAQVDTKFAKLEKVIHDADERVARLERVLGRPGREPAESPTKTPATPAKPDTPPPNVASARAPVRAERSPSIEPSDPRFQRVYDLVDAGASAITAAQQLNMPVGEVELILNLRQLR